MPILDQVTRKIADQLPSVISPGAHAVADYATAAAFVAYGAWSWNQHRRAALTSLLCGAFELAITAVTDYPGGVAKHLSFKSHGRIDIGLAAMVGTMPSYMGFEHGRESRFFQLQAVALAAVTGLTDFTGTGERRQLKRLQKEAA